MRGKERGMVTPRRCSRIIPAGAGKSAHRLEAAAHLGDHPRGCGEKPSASSPQSPLAGSSPRVRGKGHGAFRALRRKGIIPAGAGKRRGRFGRRQNRKDHPRGCGEKTKSPHRTSTPAGSSPRVRGKAETVAAVTVLDRIIPAGAGKRPSASSTTSKIRDHPRGCGEKARY